MTREFTGWVNLYEPGDDFEGYDAGCVYPDKAMADAETGPGRIACVHLDFAEGDGL